MSFVNVIDERERIQGSEGYAQYILASLIMGCPPPGYNKGRTPSESGQQLIERIWNRCFGGDLNETVENFFWEFCLNSIKPDDPDRWPDLAAITPSRVILFELKTLSGSIREGQVDEQIQLGKYNHPESLVDMIYITADPVEGSPDLPSGCSYSNVTWSGVAEDIAAIWNQQRGPESDVARQYLDYLNRRYGVKTIADRDSDSVEVDYVNEMLGNGLCDALIRMLEVESSSQTVAIEFPGRSPKDARRFVDEIELMVGRYNEVAPSPIRNAKPWVWQPSSTGEPQTKQGREMGVELRVAYNQKPQR